MSRFSLFGNDLYSGKRSFNIVGRRNLFYLISLVLLVLAAVGVFGRGLNFGIEFRGGTELRVSQVQDTSSYEQRAHTVMDDTVPGETTTVTLIGDDTVRIQTGEMSEQEAEGLRAELGEEFDVPTAAVTRSLVGPSWGQTVTQRAVIALGVFLLLVTAVLSLYFRTWKMAVATLVGTPTGGALLKEVDEKHFTGLIIFSGVLTLTGTVILASAGVVGSKRLRRLVRGYLPSQRGASRSQP